MATLLESKVKYLRVGLFYTPTRGFHNTVAKLDFCVTLGRDTLPQGGTHAGWRIDGIECETDVETARTIFADRRRNRLFATLHRAIEAELGQPIKGQVSQWMFAL